MNGRRAAKSFRDENFPVASVLIGRPLRPVVRAFYAVARAADDIADAPDLAAEEKLIRLDRVEAALRGTLEAADVVVATRARHALEGAGVTVEHATRLLRAFRTDAVRSRYDDWDGLMAYCADSANPVGHFLLDLHREDPGCRPAADALCSALQILNHLQDCGSDYRTLDRIYLPAHWLAGEGVPDQDLGSERTSPRLRRVLDRCLAGVVALLAEARPLPGMLRSPRLALEAAVILALATALARTLSARDPLAGPVGLSKPAMLWHALPAVTGCAWDRLRSRTPGEGRPPA